MAISRGIESTWRVLEEKEMKMIGRNNWMTGAVGLLSLCLATVANAALSGAIFTTVIDGSEVNFNHYAAKEDVYLDGGPGPGAPQTAAGLPDGRYVFQVTDPSGKVLLSTDTAANRQFDVLDGIIVNSETHATGFDVDHGALTVQLFPYNDTPNPGGVYKVWVTPLADYLAGAAALGSANGLNVVDPGLKAPNFHGFIASKSKTDNFKVKAKAVVEIDTRFVDPAGKPVLGPIITWTDTLGGSNHKVAYRDDALDVENEAHVEAPEEGTHTITITDGPGYKVTKIHTPDGKIITGAGSVQVKIPREKGDLSVFIYVDVVYVP
jgi:hypothetical protein